MTRFGRYFRIAFLIAFIATLLPAQAFCADRPLVSPWDGKIVQATQISYACPAIAHVAPDLVTDGFYRLDDPTHSTIDPVRMEAYRKSSGSVKQVGLAIVDAADRYRTTGSRAAADCAAKQILTLAQENSLAGKMSSNQAYYVQGWVAGAVAIAYLKVSDSGALSSRDKNEITAWLVKIGAQTRNYYDQHAKSGHGDSRNNHLYWAGLELAAIGVAANDRSDFDWGLHTYDVGVSEIRPDGSLPLEMSRGKRALHYHLYALAPLVMLAEFGEVNGQDIYSHANGALHRLVRLSVQGLQDPSFFAKTTGREQEAPHSIGGEQIAWATPYIRRFPDATLAGMVKKSAGQGMYYLGGLPPE